MNIGADHFQRKLQKILIWLRVAAIGKIIAILGAGWAGCHAGLFLKKKGHEITIFEKESKIFTGSSGNNQFRHHKGYHYPRSFQTIEMIKNNSCRFEQDYGFCLQRIPENYYAISKNSSLIDSGIYEKIFPELVTTKETIFNFKNLSRIYKTNESLIATSCVVDFFTIHLKDNILYETLPSQQYENYDLVIDCTNNNKNTLDLVKKEYKLYVLEANQSLKDLFSITIMDGDFCSIYPHETQGKYTLSHVKYSDLSLDLSEKERMDLILESIGYFFDEFKTNFKVVDSFIGIKNFNKHVKDASRLLEHSLCNNVLSFSMTKILSIYEIEDLLEGIL